MTTTVEPRLFGVLGDPVDHSLSPAMHNAAFAALGLPHLYLRWRVSPSELPAALDEAQRLGVAGLNLTVPLKETVLPLLDEMTPEARRIGAVEHARLPRRPPRRRQHRRARLRPLAARPRPARRRPRGADRRRRQRARGRLRAWSTQAAATS